MFGTNLPVNRLFSSAERIILACKAVLAGFTHTGQDELFRSNAFKTYRIQEKDSQAAKIPPAGQPPRKEDM